MGRPTLAACEHSGYRQPAALKPASVDLEPALGYPVADIGKVGQPAAKGAALQRARIQSLRQIKPTDPPCGWGMMDALNTLIAPDLTP